MKDQVIQMIRYTFSLILKNKTIVHSPDMPLWFVRKDPRSQLRCLNIEEILNSLKKDEIRQKVITHLILIKIIFIHRHHWEKCLNPPLDKFGPQKYQVRSSSLSMICAYQIIMYNMHISHSMYFPCQRAALPRTCGSTFQALKGKSMAELYEEVVCWP